MSLYLYDILEKVTVYQQKGDTWLPGAGDGRREWRAEEQKETSSTRKQSCVLTVVVAELL